MPTARLLGAWITMAVAMSANGVFRELVLKTRMSDAAAEAASAALGCIIIVGVTGLFFRPLLGLDTRTLAGMSVVLVGLTVLFEFAVGRLIDHKSWHELLANYAFWEGRLWPLVLLVLALTPFLWGRWLFAANVAR